MQDTPTTIYTSYAISRSDDNLKQEAWVALLPLRVSLIKHSVGLSTNLGPSGANPLVEELKSRYPRETFNVLGPDQTDLGARSAHILARQMAETELKYPMKHNTYVIETA